MLKGITEGQWQIGNTGVKKFEVLSDKRIAVVDRLADAQLIAAAPDMYEALQNALWHLSPNHNEGHATIRTDELLNTIRQALSRAEGIC